MLIGTSLQQVCTGRLHLGTLPQLIQLVHRQRAKLHVALGGLPLHVGKASRELGACRPKGGLGVDPQLSRQVDEDHQQVAELLAFLLIGRCGDQLSGLLSDFVEHAFQRRPVIAERRGTLLHLLRVRQRRQGFR